ncbi:MAG: FAD-dependent oxidoreductase [Lachnospiraceae bacterium]|nr:FAD-dependent oxidoreductase [Lachnospiraceae bacterium]
MIRINQLKIRVGHTKEQLLRKTADLLGVPAQDITAFTVVRQSVDARKKPEICYSYTLDVQVKREDKVLREASRKKNGKGQVEKVVPVRYRFPRSGTGSLGHPPVIVGMGPAGLFCGYFLSRHGYRPILLERGRDVESRQRDVEAFWKNGILDPASNVQFGEGGAGTFSDGKLNTLVKDRDGRNRAVLETFVAFGAKESILYEARPHIGTDVLSRVVKNMREEIVRLGGKICFESRVTDLLIEKGAVAGVVVNGRETIDCSQLVLAIGHSARDTFFMLHKKQIPMEAKAFAVGFRVEHPQEMINLTQYGVKDPGELGAAPYKVTAQTSVGRGVYSFCMCPGGYVVNASSEPGHLAVNGMSYSGRDGKNANSAIIVAVTPKDYGEEGPLAGIAFQRELERRAYELAGGKIPVQRYGDFRAGVDAGKPVECTAPADPAEIFPQCKGAYEWADLTGILPRECNLAFVEGMECLGHQIKGFDRPDAVLSGIESRTSSPVRILRDESFQSKVRGLYPCGEGAGYAGGITSAAMDGIRAAEAIASVYGPIQTPTSV